ncbi:hypothetical protein N7507_001101 [Penicillium longicatenatum]|nr:hypothetical protein N7507_001101 [Penicillium longicatenatum]
MELVENDLYQISFQSGQGQEESAHSVAPICPSNVNQGLRMHGYSNSKIPSEVRKGKLTRRQRSISINKADPQQLNEDNLFQLLIGKMKQREESEVVATHMCRQIETKNALLKDENDNLRRNIHVSHLSLQKSAEELNAQRSLLGEWKSKIRNFKQVVNELGHGYDALRDQADQHRENAMLLDKERGDLTKAIELTKLRISQAEGLVDTQQQKIAESDKNIALLEQSLSSSREGEESAKSQLSEQKMRVVTLETFIQNYALSHTKKLDMMKEGQKGLIESITTGLNAVTRDFTNHKDAVLLAIRDAFEDFRTSIQSLNTKLSEEHEDATKFTLKAQEVIYRIGVLSSQFSDNVDSGIEIHNEVAKTLQKKFDEFECHLGPSSPVIKCLAQCDNTCAALESKLGTIKPTLNALETSAKALIVTENALAQDLASFGKKLADAQLSTSNSSLEADLASKFAENTLLQAQLHDVGSKIDILQQTVYEKEILIIDTQKALVEITSKQEKAECENKQLETEKAALRLQLEDTEQKIRHELSKQNADLMDKMRADHQAEIDGFQKEKDEVEEMSGKLMIQLGGIQNSLETEQQIQDLERSEAESKVQLEAQRTEIEKFQQLDATSRVENSDLRDRLEQAQQKIHDLEHQLASPIQAEEIKTPRQPNIVSFATIESQLLEQHTTSQYGESCDFAMLFMSDDQSPPTPTKETTFHYPKNPDNTSELQRPAEVNKEIPLIGSEKLNSSPNKKRKGVVFDPPQLTNKEKESMKVQPVASEPEKEPEEHPNKVSKHIHKWTYSRVHNLPTETQQEQTRAQAHAAKADRLSTPKGLVSASSAPEAPRPKTRNRGRRRGRGTLPISVVFDSANGDLQVNNTMRDSWKTKDLHRSATRNEYPILSLEF